MTDSGSGDGSRRETESKPESGTGSDSGFARDAAVDRVERIVDTIESDRMPVPVREVWVFGDLALGLDPIDRLDVYLTKEVLFRDAPDRESDFLVEHGIEGVGKSVRADWADQYPQHLRANQNGHAAPERCLAAHLLDDEEEPIHLEVCNASFEDNVTQRLQAAKQRGEFSNLLDPRGVCLWIDGVRSDDAVRKLRESEFAMPSLSGALTMLGLDESEANRAAREVHAWREDQEGATIRGDVV